MASETGAIYAKILLDDSPFTKALGNAVNTANSTLSKITGTANTTSNSFDKVSKSISGIGKDNTLDGLNERLKRLNEILGKTQIGSERFKNLSAAIEDTKSKLDGAGQKANSFLAIIGSGIAAIGIASLVKNIISIGSNFSAQMSQVAAASNASKEDFNKLSDAARQLGATTQFSATQAAEAMTELAKAGLNTNQILSATKDVLSLAQAGSISLGEAATFVADSMSQFGLAASDTQKIADTLANAANASTISVQDVGESFKYAAGVAKTAGVNIEETATLIAMLGNSGIKASMAGTTLKSMFLLLSSPSKEASKALTSLGISSDFVSKNLDKPKVMLEKLSAAMTGASAAKKLDLVSTIFGTEPAAGMIALMDKVGTEYDKTLETISKKGGAAEFGKKATDNLKGDMANLSSAMEEAQLKIYSALEPVLRFITQSAASLINGFGNFITKVNEVLNLLGPFGDGIRIVAIAAAGLAITIGVLSVAVPILASGFGALATASSGIGTAFMLIASKATAAMAAISSQGLTGALSAFMAQLNAAAAGAAARWAMILGPFALVAAVVYTITYLEKWRKEDQEKSNDARTNKVTAGATQDLASGLGTVKKVFDTKDTGDAYKKLGSQIGTISGTIQDESNGMANSIRSIETAAAAASAMGLKKLSQELLNNKNNSKLAKEALDIYQKQASNFKDNYTTQQKPTGGSMPVVKTGAGKKELETLDDFINRAIKLDEITKGGIEFNVNIPMSEMDANKKDLEKWAADNKVQLEYTTKFDDTKQGTDKQSVGIDFKLPENITAAEKEQILKKLKTMQATVDSNSLKALVKAEFSNLNFGSLFATIKGITDGMKAFDDAIKKATTGGERLGLTLGKGLLAAQGVLQSVGSSMINMMQSQGQLANAKLEKGKQQVSFFADAIGKMNDDNLKNQINAINAETNARVKGFDDQLKAIDLQKAAELESEKAFQAEMKALKLQLDAESKAESERKFNEAWALRQADYDNQLATIDASTADNTEKAISEQTLLDQQNQEKLALKAQFDEQLSIQNDMNSETINQKQEAKKGEQEIAESDREKKKQLIEEQKTAFLATQENKRQQVQDAADKAKTENAKKVKMLEWVMGRSAFEINKQTQMAQVRMQLASIMMSAVQAMAGLAAATGGLGLILGMALAGTITAMGIAASATSMAAINTAQYPPPPVFAQGGIVPGNSFSGDKVPAMVNSGEMILNQSQQNTLLGIANNSSSKNNSSGSTNIYFDGVNIQSLTNASPSDIADVVGNIIRGKVYQAVTR